jgi:hypothetical protein
VRTTVTLDDDVAAALRTVARERGLSFKEALNSAVRRGLFAQQERAEEYVVPTFELGIRPEVNIVKANQLVADLEDEAVLAKLELRK